MSAANALSTAADTKCSKNGSYVVKNSKKYTALSFPGLIFPEELII